MTDSELLQLWEHFGSDAQAVVKLARSIEGSTRAACADEIIQGHSAACDGPDCHCQHLHTLLRVSDPERKADVIRLARPEMFDQWKTGHVQVERNRLLASIDAALIQTKPEDQKHCGAFAERLKQMVRDGAIA